MLVKQRDLEWDFIKCILMFLIIFGHLCPASESWTPVTRIIGLFVIPGFFFVSGYFQSRITNIVDLIGKFRRALKRIVVPMFSWGTIYVLLTLILFFYNGIIVDRDSLLQFIKYYPFYVAGIYWFLTALLLCIVIGSLLSWGIEKKKKTGLWLALFTPFCFCLMSPNFMERYHFSFIWLFYLAGMFYKQIERSFVLISNIKWSFWLIPLFLVSVVFGVNFAPQFSFYYTENVIGKTPVDFIITRYSLYFAATAPVIYVLKWFYTKYNKEVKKWETIHLLASIGKDTLFIYCSHVLVLEFLYKPILLPYLYHEQGDWFVRAIEHIEGLVASVLLYWLIQILCLYCKRFKWLRVVFMGTN